MKKVIIFHISDFGGHSKAASNIEEALLCRDPSTSVLNLNGFGYFYPRCEKLVDYLYTTIIKSCPGFWGSIYDRKRIVRNLNPLRKFANKRAFKKLASLINNFTPDCFVATQAFPCGIVADFKKHYVIKTPLIAVVTDYYPHRFWIHDFVDIYIVACEEAKKILMAEGVAQEKIKILGIPVSVNFLTTCGREKIAEDFGFSPKLRSVLLMGGGLGIGPLESIARQLDTLDGDFQIIAVCGKNKKLYDWFGKNKKNFKKPIFFFAYVDFIHKLMDFADVIITKGGGITISEALAKGLAIITVNSIPGQEERNVNYLLGKHAIMEAAGTNNICGHVAQLFSDTAKLTALRKNAREISSVDSSLKIADLILEILG